MLGGSLATSPSELRLSSEGEVAKLVPGYVPFSSVADPDPVPF
jgi:hypothetical protein